MTQKKVLIFFTLFLYVLTGSAQLTDKDKATTTTNVSAKEIEKLTFSKGTNNFTIMQNFGYSRTKPEDSDNSTRSMGLNLDYNRFIADGIAVGAQLELNSVRSELSNINVVKSTSSMIYGNAMYGTSIGGTVNIYAKASVGFGQSKYTYTGSPAEKEDLFGYRIEVGAPIHLYNEGGNYFTPFIRYDHLQQKDEDVKYSDNIFSLGFQFQHYSPCSGYSCDCKHQRRYSGKMYEKGRNFISYTSMGEFGFGNNKFEYSNISEKTDVSGGSLNFQYGHYISKDIALGAGLSWSGSSEDDGSGKNTSSDFSIMPMITLNAPAKNCFENFFLQGGFGFGFEKFKSGSVETKYNTTDLGINIGFNHFISNHLAVTPKIGFASETFKNTNTDIKDKQSGFSLGIGFGYNF